MGPQERHLANESETRLSYQLWAKLSAWIRDHISHCRIVDWQLGQLPQVFYHLHQHPLPLSLRFSALAVSLTSLWASCPFSLKYGSCFITSSLLSCVVWCKMPNYSRVLSAPSPQPPRQAMVYLGAILDSHVHYHSRKTTTPNPNLLNLERP